MRRLVGCLTVLLLVAGVPACGDEGRASARTIRGVVVEIEARSIDDIRSFTLLNRGRRYTIQVTDDTEFAFAPGHLNEHRTTAQPVEVETVREDGGLVAVSVADADH